MNTITIALCASTRTGCLSAAIHSCADERLTLTGDLTLSAGTSLALLTPRGNTLAHTILTEECAPGATIQLSTLTAQAAEYTRSCRAGDTREALLAIGDSEHPLALIPARIAQNPLYTLAPPTDLAPAYPTTETLKSLLAEMQAASNAAAQSATAARKSAEEAGESASSAASDRATAVFSATSAQAYAEVATAAQARSSTSAAEASTSAANAASSAASARDAASSAISAANSAAGSAAKAAASADSAAFALAASTNAANRAEVYAEKAREADISAANSATAASQSAAAAAQAAAQGVATLLQGKVDAAEAAKSGAEAAKTAAETAKTGADAAKAAAASSATAAANSAAAAKQSATALADAVATAESLDGRITDIEGGLGAYKIQTRDVILESGYRPSSSDVGKIIYFNRFHRETTSTLAVLNDFGWAKRLYPAPIVLGKIYRESSACIGCFDYVRNKTYLCFATIIGTSQYTYVYELNADTGRSVGNSTLTFKSRLGTIARAGYGMARFSGMYCVHDGHVFYLIRHANAGPYLIVCDVETGNVITSIDLDPLDQAPYANCFLWYNPHSGHICVYSQCHSLRTGEKWKSGFVRVMKWDSEAKKLDDIPDGDNPVTMVDIRPSLADAGITILDDVSVSFGVLMLWPIRDQVFMCLGLNGQNVMFRAAEDDGVEPCYEWDVEYATDGSGITRPVWETHEEEWTDAEGNVKTIQNYVRNYAYDLAILPKMTKGRLLKFCCNADYDGVPSGTWSANPVFTQSVEAYVGSRESIRGTLTRNSNAPSFVILTDGVVRWGIMGGYKFVREESFNNWNHLKDPVWGDPLRDAGTGVYALNDVRKGSARRFTGWLPSKNDVLYSVGAPTSGSGFTNGIMTTCVVPLSTSRSGTPLSTLGVVTNAGVDGAAVTPLPLRITLATVTYMNAILPYCEFGFLGVDLLMTTFESTYKRLFL